MLVTLYKRNKEETEKLTGKNIKSYRNVYRASRHCHNCNSDIYGYWEFYSNIRLPSGDFSITIFPEREYIYLGEIIHKEYTVSPTIKKYREEIETFHNLKECPICKKTYIQRITEYDGAIGSWSEIDLGSSTHHEYARYDINAILEKESQDRLNSYTAIANNRLSTFLKNIQIQKNNKLNKFENDSSKLKQFISFAFQIETDYFTISERLIDLYKRNIESKKDSDSSKIILLYENQVNFDKIKKECEELQKKLAGNYFDIQYPPKPQKPVFSSKPKEPIYQKPNIFNKKRVESENEQIRKRYEEECRIYEKTCQLLEEQYKQWKKQYDEEVESLNQQKKQQLSKLLEEKLALLEAAKEKLEMFDREKDEIVTPEQIKNKLIEDEILQAEELLRSLYKTRQDIYECGIIYNKYCNFVAISSFHEYLSSGRCASLEGADGAYNIYETEIRSNMIIEQLSEVIQSLQQIQKNQHLIYSAIQETNRLLSELNSSMNAAMSDIKTELSDIKGNTKEIAHNTKVCAYYSQVNAYYAKKNAELTNALGFMVALK